MTGQVPARLRQCLLTNMEKKNSFMFMISCMKFMIKKTQEIPGTDAEEGIKILERYLQILQLPINFIAEIADMGIILDDV